MDGGAKIMTDTTQVDLEPEVVKIKNLDLNKYVGTCKWIDGHAAARYFLTEKNRTIVRRRYARITKHLVGGRKVHDIGCAWGYGTKLLTERGFDVTGYDVDIDAVTKARKLYPDLTFQVKSASDFEFGNDNYVISDIIQHLEGSLALLRKWNQTLTGILVGTTVEKGKLPKGTVQYNPGLVSINDMRRIFPDVKIWKNKNEVPHRFWFLVRRI